MPDVKFSREKERFDVSVPEGQDTFEFTFLETYTEVPRIFPDGMGKAVTSIDVTTTECTLHMKDTAGYTGFCVVIGTPPEGQKE